jgi:HAD superfamily hydrolase (TIGR01549 family)
MGTGKNLSSLIASMDGKLKSVLFDLYVTLRHNNPSPTQSLLDSAVRMGVSENLEKRRSVARWTHYYWAQSEELYKDLEIHPDEEDFWLNYIIRSLLKFDCERELAEQYAPDLQRYMAEEFSTVNVIPEDVHPTLTSLQEAGYRLALLSNRQESCNEELREWDLAKYFEFSMVAGEISSWKPEPGLFIEAMARMKLGVDEAVYVGDNYYADVIGARRAGVQPVLLDPDHVFPDADCTVISSIAELGELVQLY